MPAVAAVTSVLRIPLANLRPGPNARGDLGDLNELAMSMKALGQLQPIVVHDLDGGRFRLLDGHRRLAAARLLSWPNLDAIVRVDGGADRRITQQLAMHTQSAHFDPVAEAHALHELIFTHKVGHGDVARAVGKTPRWVSARLALLNLTEREQRDVAGGRLTLAHAQAIVAARRALRDGRPQPKGDRPRPTPTRQNRDQAVAVAHEDIHFTSSHQLAPDAGRRCRREADHARRVLLGGVACGECWEYAIRADQALSTGAVA